jgi:hypothetical protein
MRKTLLAIAVLTGVAALGGCAPSFKGESVASNPDFNEPTFVSVHPVAYPHPTGCMMCGFPTLLGTPDQ